MITYNHKYRGPFEYDKFVLNILSFHNIIENLETLEVRGTNEEINSLLSAHNEIKDIFEFFTGDDGICERSFLLALQERKCISL